MLALAKVAARQGLGLLGLLGGARRVVCVCVCVRACVCAYVRMERELFGS